MEESELLLQPEAKLDIIKYPEHHVLESKASAFVPSGNRVITKAAYRNIIWVCSCDLLTVPSVLESGVSTERGYPDPNSTEVACVAGG